MKQAQQFWSTRLNFSISKVHVSWGYWLEKLLVILTGKAIPSVDKVCEVILGIISVSPALKPSSALTISFVMN